MQNIVSQISSPAVSAPASATPADNNTFPAEPFGDVLARQIAGNVPFDESNISENGIQIISSADDMLTATTTGKDKSDETQIPPVPDGVSALPGDMLAALLPSNIVTQLSNIHPPSGQSEAIPDMHSQSGRPEAISSVKLQPTGHSEAILNDRAQSITRNDISKEHEAPTSTLDIINPAHEIKSQVLLADAQLAAPTHAQLDAPRPNTPDSAVLPVQISHASPQSSPIIQQTINTPLAHSAWADDFSQKIVWVATRHEQSAELHLNPPQLGPLDVSIKVNGDQATAIFTSPHAVVRDAIEQALPKLREMLADNGIMLGNASVSDQSPGERQAGQSGQPQKREGWQTKIDQGILAGSPQIGSGHRQRGLVDTFA